MVLTSKMQESMCNGKIRYFSRTNARKYGRNKYQRNFSGHKMEVYKCPFCGFFHIGHKLGNRKQDNIRISILAGVIQ